MSRRILLVEDDAETADYILKGLREEGYTVEHMADGRDGFYAASGSEFDAIVMDRMIPGMDGLSVVKVCILNSVIFSDSPLLGAFLGRRRGRGQGRGFLKSVCR